jgi:hypothetical protein
LLRVCILYSLSGAMQRRRIISAIWWVIKMRKDKDGVIQNHTSKVWY